MKKNVRIVVLILCLAMFAPCVLTGCKKDPVITPQDTTVTSGTDITPDPAEETGPLVIYPEFDARIQRDYLYSVSVTMGEQTASIPVYNHVEASRTTRNISDTTADQYRRFSTFAFDPSAGGVRVDIRVNCDFTSYSVIPSAKHFRNDFRKGIISVYLDQPDYFMIRLNDKDSTLLAVFADAPETDIPTKNSKTTIVEGWQEVEGGTLELKKEDSVVYIKPGAVLNARIRITADNCKVIGRGIILDPYSDIYRYDEKDSDGDYVLLNIHNANNTIVDGVHLLNARAYNLEIQGIWQRTYAKNTRITNLKILSTQMSSDGLMFNYYIKNAYAEHCFVYCGDNALNYEDEAHFKDILVGTTCNAIFPQTDIRNSSLEDIYVFRADDNIINTEYSGTGKKTIIDNSTITNLYVQDLTYTNYFIFVENETDEVISQNGGFTIRNVYLPNISAIKKGFYYNVAPANYQITLSNVSIDGKSVESINPKLNASGKYETYVNASWLSYPAGHEFSYTLASDFDPNVKKHSAVINYKNDLNVFVGAYQINYRIPVIIEGENILLPFEQTQSELRTVQSASVVERNGVNYVSASDLVSSGMAKELKKEDNKLILTPNDNNQNLILPDEGILSQFTEIRASHMAITAAKDGNSTVLHITGNPDNSSDVIGLHCLINEAIKKYGTGNYRVTCKAKSTESEKIKVAVGYGQESTNLQSTEKTIGTAWTDCTLDFSVATYVVNQAQIRLTITASWANVSEFDVKDICLIKVG